MQFSDKVRCKVYMSAIHTDIASKNADGSVNLNYHAKFAFVSNHDGKCPENAEFWKYSPNGELWLITNNKEAVKQWEMGKEYYLDIVPATGQ